uniref:ATP synthase subunit a n=1 Tax=Onchidella celtica TaxID=36933 RepID=B3DFD2_9EUPU|nr:ATP synthase F0 subunit 6 [Onchidella celtica]ACE62819.1 ATP synthase F0 subunit 6 [Onchidella celtica]
MTADLFSSLDGCGSIFTWVPPLMLVCFFSMNTPWTATASGLSIMTLTTLSDKTKKLMPLPLFSFSLIFFLVSLNLIGLFPFVFGLTSALWAASALALTFWGLLLFSGWMYNPKEFAAHLAPAGAPAALVWFLVLVETVSLLIRPLTLTVRLIANISAGHVVLSLIASCLTGLSGLTGLTVLLASVGYTLFEVFVCFIQAYIFTLLVGLYAQEHP